MIRAIRIGILLLLATASAAIGTLAYYGAHTLASCTDAARAAQAALESVNRPCETGKPCGTLADVNRTLATVRGTVGQIEIAAKHENAQLTTLDGQERVLFADLHGVAEGTRSALRREEDLAGDASDVLESSQRTLQSSQTALHSLNADFISSQALIESLRKRVDDPRIDDTISHVDGTATHVDTATGDISTAIHKVMNPPPCKGRWCWLITTTKVVSAARDVPEFGYWTEQLIQAFHR